MTKRALAGALSLICLTGCAEAPAPGEYGQLRYAGVVDGVTPLQLVPPISDRDGNAYVLFGAKDLLKTQLFVGHAGGGWSGGCQITDGMSVGLHGFVGRAQSHAWYWSGDALVDADGSAGVCTRLLEFDPATGVKLQFRAVVPKVRDTPSRTTMLAWIQSPSDARPFRVVLDLDTRRYALNGEFEPNDATDVQILGTGGRADGSEGLLVARYTRGGVVTTVARFVDQAGDIIAETTLGGLDTLPEYGIEGFLEASDESLYAGIDSEGFLIVLDQSGGQRKSVDSFTAVGVHRWDGALWVVGVSGDRPVVAPLDDDGNVGKVEFWDASTEAASLGSKVTVRDDRALPSQLVSWDNPRSALGPFPFVTPFSIDSYAADTSAWLIAGPSFTGGGGIERTAIAYAPVGVTYP